jgi:hypothetical protein
MDRHTIIRRPVAGSAQSTALIPSACRQQPSAGYFIYGLVSLPHPNTKYFLFHLSHQIFRRMHGALNVGKKDN